jgi:hypothetical protein
LEATEEEAMLNRLLRLHAREIIAVVGPSRMHSTGFLSSATGSGSDSDPIRA